MTTAVTIAGDLTGVRVVPDDSAARDSAAAPVLFVHGLFGGAWMFAAWQQRFAALGRPSLAINLRGHHNSRPVQDLGRVAIRDYVADALDAVRVLERPVVVGHSLGGLVALAVAASGAVRAAVLLCAAPPRGIPIASTRLALRQIKHARAILGARPLAPDAAEAAALVFNRTPAAERDALLARFVPDSGRVARELSLLSLRVDPRRVTCPVLSVGATDDRLVVPRIARAIGRRYGATHWALDGHAHYVIGEPGWEAVADAVAAWLDRLPAE